MGDPLFDTLFRSTSRASVAILDQTAGRASAAPVRERGTRSRAGNAMDRTRRALLDGAQRAVQVRGTKIAMAEVAEAAGVAKATLYNHFRTRAAVLTALLVDEVDTLAAEVRDRPLSDALARAAEAVSEHPLRKALADAEPSALARLARIDPTAEGWQRTRAAVDGQLARDGRRGTDTVLRWLASYLITPGAAGDIAADVAVLLAGLPYLSAEARPA
jgi:AcrR family transcriptional regulator